MKEDPPGEQEGRQPVNLCSCDTDKCKKYAHTRVITIRSYEAKFIQTWLTCKTWVEPQSSTIAGLETKPWTATWHRPCFKDKPTSAVMSVTIRATCEIAWVRVWKFRSPPDDKMVLFCWSVMPFQNNGYKPVLVKICRCILLTSGIDSLLRTETHFLFSHNAKGLLLLLWRTTLTQIWLHISEFTERPWNKSSADKLILSYAEHLL